MELKIYSLEGTIFEGQAPQVVLPSQDGEITVLPHHASLVTILKGGMVRYNNETLEIKSGFAEVGNNKAVVLVN